MNGVDLNDGRTHYAFIAIHLVELNHLILAVVSFDRTTIYIYDSLSQLRRGQNINVYGEESMKVSSWAQRLRPVVRMTYELEFMNSIQQNDGSNDCGAFVCSNAAELTQGKEPGDMPYPSRKNILYQILGNDIVIPPGRCARRPKFDYSW